ncbi:unnamed protein product [Camellia sinensis]
MDRVHDELQELKSETEKLKEECRTKKELSESLRKAHNEQLVKFMEAKSLIEEQAQQLNAKSEEISELRQICEELKSTLHEKELFLKDLNFANEKLRVEYGERIQKLEGENKVLVLGLDEATTRTQDWEKKICAGNEEIEGLKRLVLIAEKKCLEAERKAKASEELERRENVILKIEDENRNVQDQLKWKSEQFMHLEEAHTRLQDQFQLSKVEWEHEKVELLDEICSLQTRLDSQTRISQNLHSQLKMCNQALSHEESRRKILEVEVFELKSHFENVILECEEAKSRIENLALQRDEDIAELRNTLGTKESLSKEMEYKISHLEQENQELHGSLKECREVQIKNARGNSLKKLQNKLRGLEQLHSQCSVNLEEKEAEWSFRIEKMTRDVNGYISDLEGKDKEIQELQMKLEGCHCLLEVRNEEISVVTMVLKSEFSAVYTKLFDEKAEIEKRNKVREDKILLLREQLERKNSAQSEVDGDLEQEGEEGRFLVKRVECSDRIKHQESFMAEEELERHKKMLNELSNFHACLEEQVVQMESELKRSSKDVSYALERANCELARKIHLVDQTKLELQRWKSSVEKAKMYFEENHKVLKQEKDSLLGVVKEQDGKIGHLQQQVVLLESTIAANMKAIEALKQEKEDYYLIAETKDHSIEKLQEENAWLKQESTKREQAQLDAQKTLAEEEERILEFIKAKDQSIEDLSAQAMSMKQDFESSLVSFFSVVTEKQIEINVLNEVLEKAENLKRFEIQEKNKTIDELETETNKLRQKLEFQEESLLQSEKQVAKLEEAENLKELEIQEKNKSIDELETKTNELCQKLKFQEESLLHSQKQVAKLEAVLEAHKSETEGLKDRFWSEKGHMEGLVKELQCEKRCLLEDMMKLSAEREDMLIRMEGVCNWIGDFSGEDVDLMDIFGKILQNCDNSNGHAMDLVSDGLSDSRTDGENTHISSSIKNIEERIDKRSPLKALNH